MRFLITFGQSHAHRVNGKTFDCDSVCAIEAPDLNEARTKAFDAFGAKWSMIYGPEDKMNLDYYPRGILELEP